MQLRQIAAPVVLLAAVGCIPGMTASQDGGVDWKSFVSLSAPQAIASGQSAQLIPHFIAGSGEISPGIGPVMSDVPVTVTPATTTTYTLSVTVNGVSISISSTLTVTATVSVAISPSSASLQTGASQKFQGTVANSSDTVVAWSVQEAGGGSIAADGTYTAPATAGMYHVVATCHADPTRSSTASVMVSARPASGPTIIYDDALPVAWQDRSWATHDLANAAPVSAGTRSISVDYAPFTAISFYLPAGVTTAGAATLEFDVNGGTTANPAIAAVVETVLDGPWGPEVNIAPYCAGGAIPAGAFTHCTVPLSALQTANANFQRIALKEVAGLTLARMYFDQIVVLPPAAAGIAVSVSPKTASVTTGGTMPFSATVTGTSAGQSTAVTWSVQEAGGGTVSSAGVYTAPATAGTYHVVATSAADTSKKDTATLTVMGPPQIAVSVSPKTASVTTGGTVPFSATVTGTTAGQSTAVTWSVQEAGGGTVSSAGVYTAPATAGTYHVVASSAADTSKKDTATLTVMGPPQIAVSVSPQTTAVVPGGTVAFTATVTGTTGGQSTAVTWSVQEGASGGTVNNSGNYTAPATEGTYHVVATSVADTSKSGTAFVGVSTTTILPADRRTTWNPGIPGGIPARITLCATIDAATYGNGSADATAGIQAAINACPVGQVVQLSAGDFKITNTLLITKGIVLRGQGPTQTRLKMPVGTVASVISVGTRWFKFTQSVNLAASAQKASTSVTLASNPGLKVGEIVAIDKLADPSITEFNPATSTSPNDAARGWFTRQNRMVGQILEVASVNGTTVSFTTPLHIGFDTAYTAQLSRFSDVVGGAQVDAVKYAGVEDLYVYGGGDGNLKLANAAYSWIKNVESDYQKGESIGIDGSFRCVVRDSYVHSTQDPNPGGGGYGFSFSFYSSDNLLENNISWNMNKVMVMRASGGGNVIGYNYMQDGWISYATAFVEVGLNASHMTTPHYELFEGNESFNFDGDNRFGNAVYITVLRNHLTAKRRASAPLLIADQGNARAIGLMRGHKWYTFLGNVLGTAGQSPAPNLSYAYESFWPWSDNPVGMWRLGYNNDDWTAAADPNVTSTIIREGNFDYATNQVHWSGAAQPLPASLYLSAKPAFFGSNPWPWVDATGTTKLATLPARVRFDALHP